VSARPRVLVIDDAPTVRTLMRRTLPFYEIDVAGEAEDALDGVAQAAALQPDAILLDLHLPDRNGTEIIRELKAVAPKARIVMFTNDDRPEAVSEAMAEGADAFVVKLTLIPDLAAEIRRLTELDAAPLGADV